MLLDATGFTPWINKIGGIETRITQPVVRFIVRAGMAALEINQSRSKSPGMAG